MKKLSYVFYLVLALVLISCASNDEINDFDGTILTDLRNGKKYKAVRKSGDNFRLREEVLEINGIDTVYRYNPIGH